MRTFKLPKYIGALLLLVFIGVYSCKPKERIIQADSELEDKTNSSLFEDVLIKELKYAAFSSKMNMTFSTGKRILSSKATLGIAYDEVIQLSLQPVFGIEMFRLYVQPDCIIILDRMNKRYVRESFDDIEGQLPNGFNFYTLQALFTNKIFIPEQSIVSINDYRKFKYTKTSDNYLLKGRDKKSNTDYSFFVNGNDQVTLTQLYKPSENYSLDWTYKEFTLLENMFFPLEMKVSATTPKRKLDVSISLNSVVLDESPSFNSSIPSSYTKVELEEVMKLLSDK